MNSYYFQHPKVSQIIRARTFTRPPSRSSGHLSSVLAATSGLSDLHVIDTRLHPKLIAAAVRIPIQLDLHHRWSYRFSIGKNFCSHPGSITLHHSDGGDCKEASTQDSNPPHILWHSIVRVSIVLDGLFSCWTCVYPSFGSLPCC
jgi:hypothetical protein